MVPDFMLAGQLLDAATPTSHELVWKNGVFINSSIPGCVSRDYS